MWVARASVDQAWMDGKLSRMAITVWNGHILFSSFNRKHTVLPKVSTHLPWLAYELKWHPILNLIYRVQYDVGPSFAAITASTVLGRLSTGFRIVFMGIFDHSSRSTFVRSHTDVGREGLALDSQDSVQASQVHPHQTLSSMSLWTLLCALVHSHVGTGRGHPQTVPTKLGTWNCTTSLGIMKHSEFLSLALWGQAQLLKSNPTP